MILIVPEVLSAADVAACRDRLEAASFIDGKVTAGAQSAEAKQNLQLPQDAPEAKALGELILDRLGRNPAFISAALPARVYPPLFNRYEAGMGFGDHVDNTIRYGEGGRRYRTDLSCTLFLSEPDEYDGGELVISGPIGAEAFKLAAGDMVLYPATTVHQVTPVTRGARWASFFWVQSMVRSGEQRDLLWELDQAVMDARARLGDGDETAIRLTGTYHNLLRMWAEA
ncbi:Fe2+-dependent dioxygenase [Phenylobacterium montanum]|uniref:Fe2+-dependent dioxygenase n=1 Tax=Phenylobacterium montanum TaxID=2823693 RepID=A0A975IVU8_9CAUL|nr:Fe2+-dependent dioxygenase [Caulobacter sp. S6]QUD89223.1 Fe2+-dependent dioxygenase [Caulobacter sp. S6]